MDQQIKITLWHKVITQWTLFYSWPLLLSLSLERKVVWMWHSCIHWFSTTAHYLGPAGPPQCHLLPDGPPLHGCPMMPPALLADPCSMATPMVPPGRLPLHGCPMPWCHLASWQIHVTWLLHAMVSPSWPLGRQPCTCSMAVLVPPGLLADTHVAWLPYCATCPPGRHPVAWLPYRVQCHLATSWTLFVSSAMAQGTLKPVIFFGSEDYTSVRTYYFPLDLHLPTPSPTGNWNNDSAATWHTWKTSCSAVFSPSACATWESEPKWRWLTLTYFTRS